MKRIINSIFVVTVVTLLGSCTKDFLELEPQGLRFEENFYSNKTEIYEGLVAAYDLIGQKYTAGYTYHSSYMIRNIASDDANCGGGNAADMLDWQEVDEFRPDPSAATFLAHWWRSYFGIYRCNQIITRVDPNDPELLSLPSDSLLLKTYIAEAKFLRAYYYYELATFFGGVPLVEDLLEVSDPYPERASIDDTYAFIEKDLKDAIVDLPMKSEQASNEYQRASRGAAQSLLGKVYMFQEKYDEAAIIFEEVITSTEYELDSSYSSIFTPSGDFSIGSIFEISHSGISPADWTANNSRSFEGNVDCQLMGVRDLSGSSTHLNGWGFNKAEPNLANLFLAEDDSIRMETSIYSIDTLNNRQGGGLTWNSDYKYTGWYCNKYAPKQSNRGDGVGASELDYDVNEKVIRYADVLLLAAEAHMMKTAPDEAKTHEYINKVRDRVDLDPIDAGLTGNALFDALVKERRLELAMEGHRYFDLIRWGLASQKLVNQPEAASNFKGSFEEEKHEYFPIPLQEIQRSNGKLEQNNY
ncbi:MAG: RagB/SusD family nutrient uptake outer membrane protein [Bacteroidales bacterium]|nr:RagB/SusD family nutrient uptake outer membrane protein [Bacteroidales bacterium]